MSARPTVPLRLLLALLLAAPAAARAEEGGQRVILRLTSGSVVSGTILPDGFDEAKGITLRRDDNGGLLRLRWDQIRAEDVTSLKRSRGYLGDELPPIQVRAVRVQTATGEVIGRHVGSDADTLWIDRRGHVTKVPKASITGPVEPILVDALEVADPVQVFEERQREAPPRTALDHYNLGILAETLTLYEQAGAQFDRALELDPAFSKRDVIETKKELLAVKLREAEQTAELNRIRALKYRGAFREALAVAKQFLEKWPSSAQVGAVETEIRDVAARHRASLLDGLRADFYTFLRRLAEDRGRDRELELGEAMTWAKEQAFDEVIAKLAERAGLTPKEFAELWKERGMEGAPQVASYGGGTFVLGEGATAGYDEKADKEKDDAVAAADGAEKHEKTLQERIQEALEERQKEARKKSTQEKKTIGEIADVPPTPDEWWAAALPNDREAFLLAFFAEQSGHASVISLRRRDCTTCYGKGVIEFFGQLQNSNQQGVSQVACPRCKTLTFDRVVVFK